MPRLQQLECSLLLGRSDIQVPEYRVKYNDSAVECRVACPDLDINFNILLEVNSYIAPGIAVLVYIDGIYQCNRNVALSTTGSKALRLRQKEEKLSDGSFVGREWTFTELGKAPSGFKRDRHFEENVGKIEIIVRRCCYDAVRTEKQEKAVKSAPHKRPSGKPASAPSVKSASVAGTDLFANMLGLFDGAMSCGQYDGNWDLPGTGDQQERSPPRSSRRYGRQSTYYTSRPYRRVSQQTAKHANRARYRSTQSTERVVEDVDAALRHLRKDLLKDILNTRGKRRDKHSSSSSSESDSSSSSGLSSSTSSGETLQAYKSTHRRHKKHHKEEKSGKKHKKHDRKYFNTGAASGHDNKKDDNAWRVVVPGSWPGDQAQPEQINKSSSNEGAKTSEANNQQNGDIHVWSDNVEATPDNDNGWGNDDVKNKSSKSSISHDGSTSDSSSSPQIIRAMPYWSDWNKPQMTKHSTTARHKSHTALRTPYHYAALPGPMVASNSKVKADRGVQVGEGAAYEHQTNRPTYMDSIDAPYAVFTFRYSSRHKLEAVLGRKIKKEMNAVVQEAERDRMMSMSKEQMIEELIKYKARRGSNASANATQDEPDWGATQSASGKSSKSSKSKASAVQNGWAEGSNKSKPASIKKSAGGKAPVWQPEPMKGNAGTITW